MSRSISLARRSKQSARWMRDVRFQFGSAEPVVAALKQIDERFARANQPPFTDPLSWTIVPLAVIVPFAALAWGGWANRRNVQTHKRLMLSAAILVVMGPSIARLPIAPPTLVGITVLLSLGLLLFVPLMLWDRRTQGHVHPATRFGFTMALVAVAIPLAVFWGHLPWARIAAHLPGVGA